MRFRFVRDISEIGSSNWDSLRKDNYPFLSSSFLQALETSGCVGSETGWRPSHLVGEKNSELAFAMPLYLKDHSYGEYVFDWQWASAFEAHGRRYFPKLLTAIPFTPASGPRILSKDPLNDKTLSAAIDFLQQFAQDNEVSGWHLLFPSAELKTQLEGQQGLMQRNDVQFHWHNHDYQSFDDFLQTLRSNKRKQIKRERRKVAEQEILLERKTGAEITEANWRAFYVCYKATYLKRSGHSGYLNWEFFEQLSQDLSNQVMIVLAHAEGEVIASSLFFYDDTSLYGRYWGALAEKDCLHFEACYFQGIDFAIEKGLVRFDPGTQGEHKLVRGFEPTKTSSFHWIADPDFSEAIARYLDQERTGIDGYTRAAERYLPFRREQN